MKKLSLGQTLGELKTAGFGFYLLFGFFWQEANHPFTGSGGNIGGNSFQTRQKGVWSV